jgi:small-conductance mechanosensitive channel
MGTIFQNEIYKNIALSILIVLGSYITAKILKFLIGNIGRRITQKTETDLDDKILAIIEKFVARIIIVIGLYFGVHQLANIRYLKKSEYIKYSDNIIFVLVIIIFTILAQRIAKVLLEWYLENFTKKTDTKLDEIIIPILNRISSIIIYIVGIIVILDRLGINVSGLLVSLGVGSFAIAFAAQDTLSNMISGFVIMIERPFRVGDRIKLSTGEIGDVYEIGLRSTKILDFDNALIIVPNIEIAKSRITNLSYPDPSIRLKIDIGVGYGTDIEKVKKLLIDICSSHPEVLKEPAPSAFFMSFGDSALNVSLICRVKDVNDQFKIGEELRIKINEAFEKENIEIPFPQRVVHIKNN